MRHQPGHRPYFEMLVVSPGAADRGPQQVAELRRLRRPEDAFVYEAVPVGSFEDAVCAILLNPVIACVTIYEGFAYASRHDAPALRATCWPRPASTPTMSTTTTWRWPSPPA